MDASSELLVPEDRRCGCTRKGWRLFSLVLSMLCFIGCAVSFYAWMMASHRGADEWLKPLESSTGATMFCSVAFLTLFFYLQDESYRCFGIWRLFRRRRRRMFYRNLERIFPVRISEVDELRPSLAHRFFFRRHASFEESPQTRTETAAVDEDNSSEDSADALPQYHVVQAEIHHPPTSRQEPSHKAEISSMRNLSEPSCSSSSWVSVASGESDRIEVDVPIQEPKTPSVIPLGRFSVEENPRRRRTQSERIETVTSGIINPLSHHGSDTIIFRRLSEDIQRPGRRQIRGFLAGEREKRCNPHP